MGMDLRGAGGDFRFSIFAWGHVLRLAQLNGWQPTGTTLRGQETGEPHEVWSGDYCSNNNQEVTTDDASNLADALERALPDVPDHDAIEHKVESTRVGSVTVRGIPLDVDVNPLEYFSGPDGKQMLRDFVAYCRAGSFCIG